MINIKQNGTEVCVWIEVKIPHKDNRSNSTNYAFHFNCADYYYAYLLQEKILTELECSIRKTRQESYEQGWKDAKSKKVSKQKYFRGGLSY